MIKGLKFRLNAIWSRKSRKTLRELRNNRNDVFQMMYFLFWRHNASKAAPKTCITQFFERIGWPVGSYIYRINNVIILEIKC
jgi:hypothetical protein